MNFTLVQLRYFVAAAELRSMTAASWELVAHAADLVAGAEVLGRWSAGCRSAAS